MDALEMIIATACQKCACTLLVDNYWLCKLCYIEIGSSTIPDLSKWFGLFLLKMLTSVMRKTSRSFPVT